MCLGPSFVTSVYTIQYYKHAYRPKVTFTASIEMYLTDTPLLDMQLSKSTALNAL